MDTSFPKPPKPLRSTNPDRQRIWWAMADLKAPNNNKVIKPTKSASSSNYSSISLQTVYPVQNKPKMATLIDKIDNSSERPSNGQTNGKDTVSSITRTEPVSESSTAKPLPPLPQNSPSQPPTSPTQPWERLLSTYPRGLPKPKQMRQSKDARRHAILSRLRTEAQQNLDFPQGDPKDIEYQLTMIGRLEKGRGEEKEEDRKKGMERELKAPVLIKDKRMTKTEVGGVWF